MAGMEVEDIQTVEFKTTKGVQALKTFEEMNLKEGLLRGIYQIGYEKPSAIQQRALRPISEGRDVIAQAQSGTGKTSMIALACCQGVDQRTRDVSAEVLCSSAGEACSGWLCG